MEHARWRRAAAMLLALATACGGAASDPPNAESDAEESGSAEWQLVDDSILVVSVDPWPPAAGPGRLLAEVSTDDGDQPFGGLIEFRMVGDPQSLELWSVLPRTDEADDGTSYFDAPIELGPGPNRFEFRIQDVDDDSPYTLDGWSVNVR